MVYSEIVNKTAQLNLLKGIYFIKITRKNTEYNQKIIVK